MITSHPVGQSKNNCSLMTQYVIDNMKANAHHAEVSAAPDLSFRESSQFQTTKNEISLFGENPSMMHTSDF